MEKPVEAIRVSMASSVPLSPTGRGVTTNVDDHVAARVRIRRSMIDVSLVQVSTDLGISWQQLLKYEHAIDRISASKLFMLARILGVTVDYFFEGLRCDGTTEPGSDASWEKTASSNGRARDNVRELVRAFSRIKVAERRHRVLDMVRALVDQSDEP
jgi:transcriptional regulator with XRE-family HTH domain